MSAVVSKTMYACTQCDTAYEAEADANRCVKRHERKKKVEKLREEKRLTAKAAQDRVRLEAENVSDIPALIKKYAAEYLGLEVEFKSFPSSFGMKSNTHVSPIGKPTNWSRQKDLPEGYLGWSGQLVGTVKAIPRKWKPKDKDRSSPHLEDLFDRWGSNGFTGFHTHTGSCGDRFDISFSYFLDDFPKIKAKYEEYEKIQKVVKANEEFEAKRGAYLREMQKSLMSNDSEVFEIRDQIDHAMREMERLTERLRVLRKKESAKDDTYAKRIDDKKEQLMATPDDVKYDKAVYEALARDFTKSSGGYW